MFQVVNKSIPVCIEKKVEIKEGIYNCRLETHKFKINLKSLCLLVFGVKLWNGLNDKIKMCNSMLVSRRH